MADRFRRHEQRKPARRRDCRLNLRRHCLNALNLTHRDMLIHAPQYITNNLYYETIRTSTLVWETAASTSWAADPERELRLMCASWLKLKRPPWSIGFSPATTTSTKNQVVNLHVMVDILPHMTAHYRCIR
ncbi:hypothetical protein KIN20_031336 [Parelaphostrongylus tenuis]|uniref:Uncharacterized protein n=1 Tax=Parelaphostrongylus tenuis TaxID=148309 RepID=A0AAD5R5G3_PARTN|nr:hypothetical protein KIN20_031336 [Parelaphostrongylus tenuis]